MPNNFNDGLAGLANSMPGGVMGMSGGNNTASAIARQQEIMERQYHEQMKREYERHRDVMALGDPVSQPPAPVREKPENKLLLLEE